MTSSEGEAVQVVLVTVPDAETGESLAHRLVEEGLAACVNRISHVRSVYHWKGEVQDDAEELLIMKTTAAGFETVCARVEELHPYEVPEVLALPVVAGSPAYLSWVVDRVGGASPGE